MTRAGAITLGLAALGWAAACTQAPAESPKPDAPPAEVSETSPAEPVVAAAPSQSTMCPLAIEPGKRIGPIGLGMTREQLEGMDVDVEFTSSGGDTEFATVGPLEVRLCGGTVDEVWLDDLRKAPDCVTQAGQGVDRAMPREDFIAKFDDCKDAPMRIGGAFVECHGGGLRIGWGMGEFIQVRVGRTGSSLDDDCSHALDDGTPVKLDDAAVASMLTIIVDHRDLSDYWHPAEPGRTPLRVATSEVMGAQPQLRKFGSPVVYAPAEALRASGQPFFEVTAIDGTKTTVRVRFAYAAEGIIGAAEFKLMHDDWTLQSFQLAER